MVGTGFHCLLPSVHFGDLEYRTFFHYNGSKFMTRMSSNWLKKTNKRRMIKINGQLKKHIIDCYQKIKPPSIEDSIFISRKGSVYTVQRINVILKNLKIRYNLKIRNFSSHSLLKMLWQGKFSIGQVKTQN